MAPKFTVAICGGGIGGLTAAIAISRLSAERKDIKVDIYEAAHEFTEIGAGIGMYYRPWTIMKALGIDKALRELGEVADMDDKPQIAFQLRKADQKKGFAFYDMITPNGILTFQRSAFQRCLAQQLNPEITSSYFSKRLVSYSLPSPASQNSPIDLIFDDGGSSTCDVLIGADGINSATRHTLLSIAAREAESSGSEEGLTIGETLRSKVEPVWSGSVVYRGVIPREKLQEINPNHGALTTPQNYMGKDKHIIVFPISRSRLINVVAFCSSPEREGSVFRGKVVEDCSQEELLTKYDGWEGEVQQLLQCINKPSRWAINTLNPLTIYVNDRVALLGDAAHAMTPHQGAGAGQAIEDAYILAAILAHPLTTTYTLRDALKVYEFIRLPRGNDVQRRSRDTGKMYEFGDAKLMGFDSDNNECASASLDTYDLRKLGDAIMEIRNWAWTSDPEDDRESAIMKLKEVLQKN